MKSIKVLFVSYHFFPSGEVGAKRLTAAARSLAGRNFEITVLRAVNNRPENPDGDDSLSQCQFVSVKVPKKVVTAVWLFVKRLRTRVGERKSERSTKESPTSSAAEDKSSKSAGRLRRYLTSFDVLFQGNKLWLLKAKAKVFWLCRKKRFDLVVSSGPPTVSHMCGAYAARLSNAQLILDFRDPWYLHTDAERAIKLSVPFLARYEDSKGQQCVDASTAIFVASPGIERHIKETYALTDQSIHLIRNGYDDDAVLHSDAPIGSLSLLYTGTLYWNRNPFPLLKAMRSFLDQPLIDRSKVSFTFIGNCAIWNGTRVDEWIEANNLSDVVRILPPVDPRSISAYVEDSNVLVNLAQGQPRQIPAKSYEYLASGRDVLVITEANSDVADLYREANFGSVIEPEDVDGMVGALRTYYHRYVESEDFEVLDTEHMHQFRRENQVEQMSAVFSKLVHSGTPDQR